MSTSLIKPENTQLQQYDAAQDWALMREQAQTLMKSGFLPVSIKSPEAAMAIILTGRELNIPMMTALNNIQVIQGKVTVPPQMMLALINRAGECEEIKITDDGKTAHCTMKRKGRAAHTESFSADDADRFLTTEGYGENKRTIPLSQKFNWKSQPRTMRKWRAVAACARVVFPDVITGLYTAEEMGAEVGFSDDGDIQTLQPTHEERQVKPLALVPPASESEGKPLRLRPEQVEQLESTPIADPLPETQNTTRDNEAHADLDREIKQCIFDAGGNEESWEKYRIEKKLDEQTLGWKQSLIEKMRQKLSKAQPKSNEPASGYAAQRADGARKVLRKSESGELEAQWEKPVDAEEKPKNKLKAVVDEVIAEHWPNTPEGYNEGYKATRAKIESIIGEFRNFEEISAADQAKLIAALGHWNPADDKPKAKGKK